MHYQHNHRQIQLRLNALNESLEKAVEPGVKAIIMAQIAQIKRQDAAFRRERQQVAYDAIYGQADELASLVEESIEQPKRGRKKKEDTVDGN